MSKMRREMNCSGFSRIFLGEVWKMGSEGSRMSTARSASGGVLLRTEERAGGWPSLLRRWALARRCCSSEEILWGPPGAVAHAPGDLGHGLDSLCLTFLGIPSG